MPSFFFILPGLNVDLAVEDRAASPVISSFISKLVYMLDPDIELGRNRVIPLQSSVTGDILYVFPPWCFSRIVYCSIEPIQMGHGSPLSLQRPIRELEEM